MNVKVINRKLAVHEVNIVGVSISSILLIGDAESISTGSAFDTPPTSLVVGPLLTPVQGTLQTKPPAPATPAQAGASVPLTPAAPGAPSAGSAAPGGPAAPSGRGGPAS
ncbi:hypothetical protein SAMN05428981_10837 [Bacillus sp. OV194]|uniref:hypothetical protein n=1 Tax=Fictibacillus sp. B-59209 TaxID=3024873 RepID=UPI0008DFF621|nr:hypothetical protein SAMN05428981_10837 [Bacillus sp. OV194]